MPGITWLEERWALESDEDRAALAAATGIDGPGLRPAPCAGAALNALTAALGCRRPIPPIARGVLTALVDAGFLSVDAQDDGAPRLDGLAGASPRVLLLTGTDASDRVTPAAAQMVDRASAAGLPTVAAEAFVQRSDGPERGQGFARTMEDDVRDRIVLVDDAELPQGRVAAILALVEVAAGRVGHFGYGADADGILPAWTAP